MVKILQLLSLSFVLALANCAPAVAQGVDLPLGDSDSSQGTWKIGRGSRGAKVSDLQNKLRSLGFKIQEDGIFGPNTERALRKFQDQNNLPASGLFGPKSQRAIGPAIDRHRAAESALSAPATPSQASNGDRVETYQETTTTGKTVGLVGALLGKERDTSTSTDTVTKTRHIPGAGEPWVSPTPSLEKLTDSGKTLKFGARGEEVRELQQFLKDQGFDAEPNGVLLGKTRDAIKAWQDANGLKPDGVIGRQSVGKINELSGKPDPDLTPPTTDFGVANQWLSKAIEQLGVTDTDVEKSRENNDQVSKFHAAVPAKSNKDSIPWCSSFASWVMQQSGLESANTRWARDWNKYGTKLDKPVPGSIVVFSRVTKTGAIAGHVGFYLGEENGKMLILGGNQSFHSGSTRNGGVNIQRRDTSEVLGYRWPPGVPLPK